MPIPLRRWLSFIKLSSFHIFVIEVLVHPSSLNIFSISSRSGAAYFSCSAARWYSACVKLCYSFSFFVRWVVCFSRKENSITLVNQTYYREKKTHMDMCIHTLEEVWIAAKLITRFRNVSSLTSLFSLSGASSISQVIISFFSKSDEG